MGAPLYSAADYLAALQALLPRGSAWPRDPDAVMTQVLAGLAQSYADQNARDNYLLVDAFPETTLELLSEWEASLGLPSSAAGPTPSILARQTLVLARFVGAAGPSTASLIQYAALLGYTVTIQSLAPFRCGQSRCGNQLGTADQMYVWQVTTAAATNTPFRSYGPAVLESELLGIAPAHTLLTFNFV